MNRLKVSATLLMAISLGVGSTLALTASTADAAGRDHSAEMVRLALTQEIDGSRSGRAGFLQAALMESADCAPARWHSGFVRAGDRWVKVDEVPRRSAADDTLAAYGEIRQKYPQTVDGRLKLANWCKQRGLRDQERAHLTELLEMSPDQAEARRRLGFRRVGGTWLSDRELQEGRDRTRETLDALKRWQPKLEKIGRQLASSRAKQRELGKSRLQAVNDPEAIPAMELVLAIQSEKAALAVVEALSRMRVHHEAALALARQAVFSPFPPVRKAAAEKLRPRDRHYYVPALLATMQTPVQSRAELFQPPRRRLTYRHTFYREGQYDKQLAVVDVAYDLPRNRPRAARRADRANVLRNANDSIRVREQSLARRNEMAQRFNERVCAVLATTTDEELPASPQAWWQWWNDEEGVYVGDKQWDRTYVREQRVPDPIPRTPIPIPQTPILFDPSTPRRGGRDCLAAGTPVWTERGMVAIKAIRVGDRVLSQHAETGELAYKPVLRTTARPAEPLVRVHLDGETIQSSDGHPFWVSGKGWVLAKRLQPGEPLHGVTGTSAIRRLETGPSEPTYNLIVADFHTYFVGAAKVLSHDNTLRQPTNRLVPGLSKE